MGMTAEVQLELASQPAAGLTAWQRGRLSTPSLRWARGAAPREHALAAAAHNADALTAAKLQQKPQRGLAVVDVSSC